MGKKAIYAERTPEGRVFLRGMSLAKGEKVLVVDDVMTTGGSVIETIEAVKRAEAQLMGVAVFIDRSSKAPDFGVPFLGIYGEKWRPSIRPIAHYARKEYPWPSTAAIRINNTF